MITPAGNIWDREGLKPLWLDLEKSTVVALSLHICLNLKKWNPQKQDDQVLLKIAQQHWVDDYISFWEESKWLSMFHGFLCFIEFSLF